MGVLRSNSVEMTRRKGQKEQQEIVVASDQQLMFHHKRSENSTTVNYPWCRSSLPRDVGRRYFASRVLKSSIQALYGFLCVRLCGTRCAGPRRARVLRGR